MGLTLPLFLLLCLAAGALRRAPVYDAFLEGAREGLKTAWSILPAMAAMLCAIRAFSACGLLDAVCGLLSPAAALLHLPKETLPLMLLRPVSGSASLAMLKSILHTCGQRNDGEQ